MKKVGIAILGLGTVGGGTYKILQAHADLYRKTQGVDLSVESVLECDKARIEALGIPAELAAHNIAEIVANPDVHIIVETIGGVTAAREYVLAALNAGKTVVTSNKELVCKYSHELERAAKRQNAGFYFEASCMGGVPVIRTLLDGLQANEITTVAGIINGTTNYVLSQMEDGTPYEEALAKARELGYAEADPSADVEGLDAAYKLSILASLAFHVKVPPENVYREGIGTVSKTDALASAELGYRLKLLAVAKRTNAGIEARVHPALVREDHPLANVNGSCNAVCITGDSVGEIVLSGKGAGELPTGSAVVSDILYAATHADIRYSPFKNTASAPKDVRFSDDFESCYYLRIAVADRSGVLAKISSVFGKDNISVAEIVQRDGANGKATALVITHKTHEYAIRCAVPRINATGIAKVEAVLRVL